MRIRVRTVLIGVVAIVALLVVGVLTAVGWEVVLGPKARPVTNRSFEATPERLARGRYLAEGPAHCFHCHSNHDFSDPSYPIIPATKGAGWVMPIPELRMIAARNITADVETGIGAWSDDEIARAIREGISRDGSALFPLMPYLEFAQLSDEDLASIVVYLRTIPPVRNRVPARDLPFPLSVLVKTMPVPITEPRPAPPSTTPEERGRHLATIATCSGCHTPAVQGEPLPGLDFAGGGVIHDPGQGMKEVFTLNITPDASGIAHYDLEFFRALFRTGRLPGRTLNHIMPFEFFRNMTDEDLGDLWAYVKTLEPIQHRVSNTDPPTLCPRCNQTHGLGELNVSTP